MKKFFETIRRRLLPVVALVAIVLTVISAKAAGKFYGNTLINGTSLNLTNNSAFTNGTQTLTYTPNLSEQYPVGFGGGTNWFANGWTYYTNQSGVIVTNPLPLLTTNLAWASDAHFRPNRNGDNPSLGIMAELYGPDNTSTNTVTFGIGQCVGTNHLTSAFWTFALKGTGTNIASIETNVPTAFLQGCDGLYVAYFTTDNKAPTNTALRKLNLTGWDDGPQN